MENSKSLYVGNLPWRTTEDEIKALFSEHGKVHGARIVTERETGRSRGFAFVDVAAEDCEKIVSAMNGFNFKDRPLKVNEATPRKPRTFERR